MKPRYVVKFGDLYSSGRPALREQTSWLDLFLTIHQKQAFVFLTKTDAVEHAVVWTGDALAADASAGVPFPRVVKLTKGPT